MGIPKIGKIDQTRPLWDDVNGHDGCSPTVCRHTADTNLLTLDTPLSLALDKFDAIC